MVGADVVMEDRAERVAKVDAAAEGPLEELLQRGQACSNETEAETILRTIIRGDATEGEGEDVPRIKEQAILALASLLVKHGRAAEVNDLLESLKGFFSTIAKAKTAKIVRSLLDALAKAEGPNAEELQVQLCIATIKWCREEKRTFLRQRIEGRLASLYLSAKKYGDALDILDDLLREVKRLDDKAHLLEIQLIESRVHHALRNVPKAKAALTSARTTANSIYVPLTLQAEIDMQAGVVAAEEKDYKTAYSYFYEGFEGFMSLDSPFAVSNLKYMLLCKIMTGNAEDVANIVHGKIGLKYAGRDVDAMKAVAKAYKDRSLEEFESNVDEYRHELTEDPVVHSHLSALQDTLLEQNLVRFIEPFSKVEIEHIGKLINLRMDVVESKLSQMILDKKLNGILDQGSGCLIVFDDLPVPETYQASLNTITNMSNVVDSLFDKASGLR